MTGWSAELILWLQQFSPALDPPFRLITHVGSETFFLVLIPLLYWCVDRAHGARLAMIFLLSTYVGSVLKLVTNQPRPFEVDTRIQPLVEETTSGMPSLHTQTATAFWPYLALTLRRRWLWIVTAAWLMLIPLSRLYLGMHSLEQIAAGYVVGLLLLLLFLWWQPPVERWMGQQTLLIQLAAAFVIPVFLFLLLPAADDDAVAAVGTFLGIGVGIVLERAFVRFESAGSFSQRLGRFFFGFLILALLYVGLRIAFAGLEPEPLWRIVRYGLIGLWTCYGAPWCFVRTRLAAPPSASSA